MDLARDKSSIFAYITLAILGIIIVLLFYNREEVPWKKASYAHLQSNKVDRVKFREELTLKRSISLLASRDPEAFEKSVWYLEQHASLGVPDLIGQLKQKDISLQKYANTIYALGRIGTGAKESVPAIIHNLRHNNADIRAISAHALGKIGEKASTPFLANMLDDENQWVRESVLIALETIEHQ